MKSAIYQLTSAPTSGGTTSQTVASGGTTIFLNQQIIYSLFSTL